MAVISLSLPSIGLAEDVMTYSTLMVHLELEQPNDARLHIAGELAEKFDAKLIGIAATEPQPAYYAEGGFARGLVEHERSAISKRMTETEERFRAALQNRVREIEWRAAMARPAEFVAREARAADLVIIGTNPDGALLDPLRRLDPGDLVMQVGRPILVVPPEAEYLRLNNVMVAWKDTREARRAVADALPLLHKAKEINVVEIIEGDANRTAAKHRVDDVAHWLARHDIAAVGKVMHAVDEGDQIDKIWKHGADLVVAGAYGHSRFREWVLGGVTRNLLTRSRHCAFIAH
jgi:nucleotide-binding universal stress UspA family protein